MPAHAPTGVITAGLKSMLRSYEITPNPVKSPTVIGTAIVPGVALMFGNDTDTPLGVPAGVAVAVFVAVLVEVDVGVFVDVAVNAGVFVGVFVDVFDGVNVDVAVAVAVFVDVAVAAGVGVLVEVFVGVAPPGIVTLPFVRAACGSPSLNINPGWKFVPGSV